MAADGAQRIDLRAKLRQVFGFKGFRPGQKRAVEYAESVGCFWEVVLDDFGRDDDAGNTCGHLDPSAA